jgi:hypothetical protein
MHYFRRAKDLLVEILKELWSPPSVAAVCNLIWSSEWSLEFKSNCYHSVARRVYCRCNRQAEITRYGGRQPSPSGPRYCTVTRVYHCFFLGCCILRKSVTDLLLADNPNLGAEMLQYLALSSYSVETLPKVRFILCHKLCVSLVISRSKFATHITSPMS